jgi:hypothetical protein
MTDVVVRRCRLRIVRTGGWSWGPDPDALLARALGALPELVGERLEALVARAGLEGEVVEPVRLAVPVTLAELRAGDAETLRAKLDEPLAAAVLRTSAAVAPELAAAEAAPASKHDEARSPPGVVAAASGRPPARTPLEQLAAWAREGVLETLLRGWPEPVLRAWAEAVGAAPATAAGSGDLPAGDAAPAAAEALRAALAATAARPRAGRSGPARAPVGAPAPAPEPGPPPARRAAARPRAVVEARALPFLMLVPLSRLGYLDALGPALAAARLTGREGAFASALARKALSPPERGWRPGALDVATAAAVAGGAAVDEAGIATLARAADDFAPVLDGIVERAVLAGHDPAAHLVLHRGPGGDLVLLDPDGNFPAAVGEAEAVAAAARGRYSALRVTVSASSASVLAALDSAGVAFVTAAPPGRHERWRRAGPGRWTNAEPGLARRCPSADEAELDRLLTALESRPACAPARPLSSDPGALERSLTLAAGVALGMLAWDLWREREETDATLALRRLGDLDARLRAEPGRLRVSIPLGQRHRDLARAGVLRTLELPWLGSVVELGGG